MAEIFCVILKGYATASLHRVQPLRSVEQLAKAGSGVPGLFASGRAANGIRIQHAGIVIMITFSHSHLGW